MKDPKKNYISIIMLALNVRLFVRCLEGIFWHITLRALRMVAERAKLRYLVLSNRGAVLMKVRFDPCFVCFAVWTLPPYSWIDYPLGYWSALNMVPALTRWTLYILFVIIGEPTKAEDWYISLVGWYVLLISFVGFGERCHSPWFQTVDIMLTHLLLVVALCWWCRDTSQWQMLM